MNTVNVLFEDIEDPPIRYGFIFFVVALQHLVFEKNL